MYVRVIFFFLIYYIFIQIIFKKNFAIIYSTNVFLIFRAARTLVIKRNVLEVLNQHIIDLMWKTKKKKKGKPNQWGKIWITNFKIINAKDFENFGVLKEKGFVEGISRQQKIFDNLSFEFLGQSISKLKIIA